MRNIAITTLLALAWALLFASDSTAKWCEFDRSQVCHGQVWRLLTCHLTHWSGRHLFWSGGTFVVLTVACECRDARATALTILASSCTIALGIWLAMPIVSLYRGLSGIDSALLALLPALMLQRAMDQRMAIILLAATYALFISKTAAEYCFDLNLFVGSNENFAPLPAAHLLGFVTGSLIGVWRLKTEKSLEVIFKRRLVV